MAFCMIFFFLYCPFFETVGTNGSSARDFFNHSSEVKVSAGPVPRNYVNIVDRDGQSQISERKFVARSSELMNYSCDSSVSSPTTFTAPAVRQRTRSVSTHYVYVNMANVAGRLLPSCILRLCKHGRCAQQSFIMPAPIGWSIMH